MPVTYVSNGMEGVLGQMAAKWMGLLDINTPAALKLYFKIYFFREHKNRRALRYWVLLSAIDGTAICSLFPAFAIIFSSSEVLLCFIRGLELVDWKGPLEVIWLRPLLGAGPA